MPLISVRASRVEIAAQGERTYVFFDLSWRIERPPESIVKIEGDLVLSDDQGAVKGRVPWIEENPAGLGERFEEPGVGFDADKSGAAASWFRGAVPSWIHFGYVARRVVFASGRTAYCRDCE